jgi:hypothetical protein
VVYLGAPGVLRGPPRRPFWDLSATLDAAPTAEHAGLLRGEYRQCAYLLPRITMHFIKSLTSGRISSLHSSILIR